MVRRTSQRKQLQALLTKQASTGLNSSETTQLANLSRKLANTRMVQPAAAPRVPAKGRVYVPVGAKTRASGLYPAPSANIEGLVRARLGKTRDGQNWAMTALHPCCDSMMEGSMPDAANANIATPVYRGESSITYNPALFTTAPATPLLYSIQIMCPPIPEIQYCYRLYVASNFSNWVVVRQPNMDNPGGVAAGISLGSLGYKKQRITARGLTAELDAAALSDKGRVVAGQLANDDDWENYTLLGLRAGSTTTTRATFGTTTTNDEIMRLIRFYTPDSEGQLVSACPRAYEAQARAGVYMPLRFDQSLTGYQYQTAEQATVVRTADTDGAGSDADYYYPKTCMQIYSGSSISPFDTSTSSAWSGLVNDRAYPAAHILSPFVSQPSGMMTGHIFFLDLIVGTNSQPGESVRVKSRTFLECQTASGPQAAGVAPYIHPPALLDMVAIEQVATLGQAMPDAFPARDNGFGDILGKIWNAITSIGRPIARVARWIPGAGAVADIANDVFDIGDSLASRVPVF